MLVTEKLDLVEVLCSRFQEILLDAAIPKNENTFVIIRKDFKAEEEINIQFIQCNCTTNLVSHSIGINVIL